MKATYDFSDARRGAVVPTADNKLRITIRLDPAIVEWFKSQAEAAGGGNYQTMINQALHDYIARHGQPVESIFRKVIREELQRARRSDVAGRKPKTVHG